jgi:hypothetical protein
MSGDILMPADDGTHRLIEADAIRALVGYIAQRDRICDGCGEPDSVERGPVDHPPGAGAIHLHAGCAPRRGPGTRVTLRALGHTGTITGLLDTPDYGPIPMIAFDDMSDHPEPHGWDELED